MLNTIIDKFKDSFSAEKIFNHVVNVYHTDHWSSFDKYHQTLLYCRSVMKEIGLEDVEVFATRADGKTRIDDMIMPLAWDCRSGAITISCPASQQGMVLADYNAIPNSIIRWSPPVADREYALVFMEDGTKEEDYKGVDVRGKAIFTHKNAVAIKKMAARHGAAGILSDHTFFPPLLLPNSVQWKNIWHDGGAWGATENDSRLFGASLSPITGERLAKIMKENKEVKIRVNLDCRLYKGKIEGLTGVIKGKTSKEILITGHMYECGAYDDASGVAVSLEIARELNERIAKGELERPHCTIRFILGWEYISFAHFVHKYPRVIKNAVSGMLVDSLALRQDMAKNDFTIETNPPGSMCVMDAVFVELFNKYARKDAYLGFSYKKQGVTSGWNGDSWYCLPNIGVPMIFPVQYPGAMWHSDLDTPAAIDQRALLKITEIMACYVYFISRAGKEELGYALDLTEQQAVYEITDLYHRFRRKILAEPQEHNYWRQIFLIRLKQKEKYFNRAVDNTRRFDGSLPPAVINAAKISVAKLARQEKAKILSLCRGLRRKKVSAGVLKLQLPQKHARIVPIYLEKTPLFFWNRFAGKKSIDMAALFYMDGKNTVRDIMEGLMDEKDMEKYPHEIADSIHELAKVGYVKLKYVE